MTGLTALRFDDLLVALWAAVLSWAGPLVVLAALGAFALALICVNQARRAFPTRSRPPTGKELGEQIRNFLFDSGYSIAPTAWPEAADFRFEVTDNVGRIIHLFKGSSVNQIVVSVFFAASDTDKAAVAQMSTRQRGEFIHSLRIELARFGVWFEGVMEPADRIRTFKTFSVTDAFNTDEFMEEFDIVRRSHVLVQSLFGLQVIHTPPAPPPNLTLGGTN